MRKCWSPPPPRKQDHQRGSPQHGVVDKPGRAQQEDPIAQRRRTDGEREQKIFAPCERLGNALEPHHDQPA